MIKNQYLFQVLLGFFLAVLLLLAFSSYQSIAMNVAATEVNSLYEKLQIDEMLAVRGFSRKQNMSLKLNILDKLNKNPDLLFIGNHQLQYFGSDFGDEISEQQFFNLWLGNLGITEIADVTSYLDRYGLVPEKALVVMITSPNNDNGNCIVGYRNELPDNIYKMHQRNSPIADTGFLLRQINYHLDYKKIMGAFNEITIRKINTSKAVKSPFKILKNGASAYQPENYSKRPLVFNENELNENESFIDFSDVEEIVDSLAYIAAVAEKNDLFLYVVVPPVFESLDRISFVNDVLSKALSEVRFNEKFVLLDHRELKLKEDPEYFYAYDHPSALYGRYLLDAILDTCHDCLQ